MLNRAPSSVPLSVDACKDSLVTKSCLPSYDTIGCIVTVTVASKRGDISCQGMCLQADKLLSQEFQVSVEGIISYLHPDRQIMLFSATFPVVVRQFKDKFLNRPHIINLMEELTLRGITQVNRTPGFYKA